jgi:hypothetical protein
VHLFCGAYGIAYTPRPLDFVEARLGEMCARLTCSQRDQPYNTARQITSGRRWLSCHRRRSCCAVSASVCGSKPTRGERKQREHDLNCFKKRVDISCERAMIEAVHKRHEHQCETVE